MTEIFFSILGRFNSWLDNAEKRISELEHIGKETIQKETQWGRYIKQTNKPQ